MKYISSIIFLLCSIGLAAMAIVCSLKMEESTYTKNLLFLSSMSPSLILLMFSAITWPKKEEK